MVLVQRDFSREQLSADKGGELGSAPLPENPAIKVSPGASSLSKSTLPGIDTRAALEEIFFSDTNPLKDEGLIAQLGRYDGEAVRELLSRRSESIVPPDLQRYAHQTIAFLSTQKPEELNWAFSRTIARIRAETSLLTGLESNGMAAGLEKRDIFSVPLSFSISLKYSSSPFAARGGALYVPVLQRVWLNMTPKQQGLSTAALCLPELISSGGLPEFVGALLHEEQHAQQMGGKARSLFIGAMRMLRLSQFVPDVPAMEVDSHVLVASQPFWSRGCSGYHTNLSMIYKDLTDPKGEYRYTTEECPKELLTKIYSLHLLGATSLETAELVHSTIGRPKRDVLKIFESKEQTLRQSRGLNDDNDYGYFLTLRHLSEANVRQAQRKAAQRIALEELASLLK